MTLILEFNQCKESDKAPIIIYADLECLIEKIGGCKSSSENWFTANMVGEHVLSGFSMFTILSFKSMEVEYDIYRGKDCTKVFSKSSKEHALEIINFKKKKWSY